MLGAIIYAIGKTLLPADKERSFANSADLTERAITSKDAGDSAGPKINCKRLICVVLPPVEKAGKRSDYHEVVVVVAREYNAKEKALVLPHNAAVELRWLSRSSSVAPRTTFLQAAVSSSG